MFTAYIRNPDTNMITIFHYDDIRELLESKCWELKTLSMIKFRNDYILYHSSPIVYPTAITKVQRKDFNTRIVYPDFKQVCRMLYLDLTRDRGASKIEKVTIHKAKRHD